MLFTSLSQVVRMMLQTELLFTVVCARTKHNIYVRNHKKTFISCLDSLSLSIYMLVKNNCLKVRMITIVMWDENYKFYLIKQGRVICSRYQPKNSVLSTAESCMFEFNEICLLFHFV